MIANPLEQSLQLLAEKTKQQNVGEEQEDLSQLSDQQQQLISNMFLQIKLMSLSMEGSIKGIHEYNLSNKEQKYQLQTGCMPMDQDLAFSLSAVLQPSDKIYGCQESNPFDPMISHPNRPPDTATTAPITLPSSRLFKLQLPKSQISSLLLLPLNAPMKSSKLIISLHFHHIQQLPQSTHPSSVVVGNCILNGNAIASLPLSVNLPIVNMYDQIIAHCLMNITVLNQETTNISFLLNDVMMRKESSDNKMKEDIRKSKDKSSDHTNKMNQDNPCSILTSSIYKSLSGENVYHRRVQSSSQDKSNTCVFSGEGRILHVLPELGEIEVINMENTMGAMSYQSIVRIDDQWLAITAGVSLCNPKHSNISIKNSQSQQDASQVQQVSQKGLISSQGWLYSPQRRQLKPLPPLNFPRFYHTSVVFRNQLVVMAGKSYGCQGDARGVLSSCERLPTLDGKWTSMGELVKARFGHSSVVLNDRLFVFGGITSCSSGDGDGSSSSSRGIVSIEEWDEQQQLWKEYAVVNEKHSYGQTHRIVNDCKLLSELFETAEGFSRQGGGNLLIFQNDIHEIEEDSHCLRFTLLNLLDKQARELERVEVFRKKEEEKESFIEDRINSTLDNLSEQLPLFDKRFFFTKSLLNEDRIDVFSMELNNNNNNNNNCNGTTRICKLAMSIACDNVQRYACERNLTNSLLSSKAAINSGHNEAKSNKPAIFIRLYNNQYLQLIELQPTTDIATQQQRILFSLEFPNQRRFMFLSHVVEMNNGQLFVIVANQRKEGEDKEHQENACYIYIPLENRMESLPGLPVCLSENQYVVYFCEELGLLYVFVSPANQQQYCFWYDVICVKWRKINLESTERAGDEWNEFKSMSPNEMSVKLIDHNHFMVSLEIAHKERVIAVNTIDLKHATIQMQRTTGNSIAVPSLHSKDQGQEKEEKTLFALSQSLLTQKKNDFLTPENHNTNKSNQCSSLVLDRKTAFPYSSSIEDLSAIEYVVFMKQSASEYTLLCYIPLTNQFSAVKCSPQSNLSTLFFNDCACAEIKYLGVLLTGGSHKGAAVKSCRIWRAYSNNNCSKADTLNPFESVNDMLNRRMQHSLVYFQNRFYAIGGAASVISKNALQAVESFDMASGVWTQEPNMFLGRKSFGCCAIRDDYILVAGGITEEQYGCDPCLTDSIEVFDGKEWKRLRTRLNAPLEGLRAVQLPSSREIVFIGGKKDRARREITFLEDFTTDEKEEIEKGKSTTDTDQRADRKTEVIGELETYTSRCHVMHVGYDLFVLGGNTLNQVQELNLVVADSSRKKFGNSRSIIDSINTAAHSNWQYHKDTVKNRYSDLMKIPNDLSHYGGTQISLNCMVNSQDQSRYIWLPSRRCLSQGEIEYQCYGKEFNRYSSIVSLINGHSIVSGGIVKNVQQQQLPIKDIFRFNKKTNSMVKLGEMAAPRFGHASMLLSEDSLLLAGGWSSDGKATNTCEIFTFKDSSSKPADNMHFPRASFQIVKSSYGIFAVGGGSQQLERYNQLTRQWEISVITLKTFINGGIGDWISPCEFILIGSSLTAVELIDFAAQRTFPVRPSGYVQNNPVVLKPFAFIADEQSAHGIVYGKIEGDIEKTQRIRWEVVRVRNAENKRSFEIRFYEDIQLERRSIEHPSS